MDRRTFLASALAAAGAVGGIAGGAAAHTPFRQWVVYRQKHLLIGSHRGDGPTYWLARLVASTLDEHLPEARARVARGPHPQRIASLIATGQLMTAVLSAAEAEAMAAGARPFENYRPTPLSVLAGLGDGYRLFASHDLPVDHALQVTAALARSGLGQRPGAGAIAPHPGAAAFWNG